MIKLLLSLLLIYFVQSDPQSNIDLEQEAETGREILNKSQQHYDPEGRWSQSELSVHIQEPRVGNPERASKVVLNNQTGYFILTRDSEIGEIERVIDAGGNAEIFVNGSPDISDELREKYGLVEARNAGYRSFYQLMYGLPMSLSNHVLAKVGDPKLTQLDDLEVYTVMVELKEPMISKNWELLISKENYSLVGLKIHLNESEREGELITFDGQFSFNDITIPRFRHWYEGDSTTYSGSDVIVRELREAELAH